MEPMTRQLKNLSETGLPDVEYTPRVKNVLAKAFWNLARHYELTRKEEAVLLGVKENAQRLKQLEDQGRLPDAVDTYFRIGLLMGIHKNLRLLFPHNQSVRYRWLKKKQEDFKNRSPMAFIAEHEPSSMFRLMAVRRYLDQLRVRGA